MSIAVDVNQPLNNSVVNGSSSADNSASAVSGSSAADLQSNFLTLLVAQLKNQDPTNPMDNNQLTTQLAQINTVSGIEQLNTTLGSISGQINSNQSLQASALLGHGVMVDGTQILAGKGQTTPFGVELATASTATSVTISDSTGKVVRTLDLGGLSAGVHSFSWDGTLTDGSTAPDGKYTFSVTASQGADQLVAQPLNYALVNGVTTDASGAILDLGTMGTTSLDNIRQII
ncbi:Flagellar basal-body rod modification protein FlgD [Paramixta manurensis]|uniref:Basal-body rod modification protein FlgD n=1 Tax=Paramixta manurensis TaxID=2740817 RepID=A0A6M8U7Q2_9GAMM|nr:Flagellar basal-body rod modification protein FlgD [Erwiniaceae bacterium PD-1]